MRRRGKDTSALSAVRTQQEGGRLRGWKGAYPPAMVAPRSQTLSPQNCEKEKFAVEASQVLYWLQ